MNTLLFDLTEIHVIEQNSMMASYFAEQLLQPHVVNQGTSGVQVTGESGLMNRETAETKVCKKPMTKWEKVKAQKEQKSKYMQRKQNVVETDEEKGTPEVAVKTQKCNKAKEWKEKNRLWMEHQKSSQVKEVVDVEMTDDMQPSQSETEKRPTPSKRPQHDCAKVNKDKHHEHMKKVRAENSESKPATSDWEKCMQKYNEAIAHGPIYVCTVC